LVKAGGAVYSELMDRCVWCKPNAGRGPLYRAAHDLVLVFKNGTAPHVDNINVGPHRRDRSNVWSYPESALLDHRRKGRGPAHANTKPVALATDIIMDASGHGDLIVGVFASAATTLLAAERTRRRAAILDVDPRRVDRLIRRWQALTGKKAVCTRSGATFAERDASSTTCEADPSRSTASGGVHS
jgi:DNA modification methylase